MLVDTDDHSMGAGHAYVSKREISMGRTFINMINYEFDSWPCSPSAPMAQRE